MSKEFIVAITGRPNVGKSTLFNRITESKISVTSPVPGVTRDRISSYCEWCGKKFTVIDTGGIRFNSSDSIETETLKQTELAIDESDLIVFMVDGKDQVHPLDKEISVKLIKKNKPVILTVNKVDNFSKQIWTDYYKLSIEKLIPVSAAHGLNINSLLDEIIKYIKTENVPEETGIRIAVVGKPNAGKSLLINSLLSEERVIVNDKPGTTRDSTDSVFKYYKKKYILIDTAGLRKKNKVYNEIEKYSIIRTIRSIERSDITVLLIDAEKMITEQDLKIADMIIKSGKGFIIALNKWDIIKKGTYTMHTFTEELHHRAKFLDFVPKLFISALTRQRIYNIFKISDLVYNNLHKKIKTVELNKFLTEVKKINIIKKKKKLTVKYILQTSIKPPGFSIFVNHPELISTDYKNYIINQLRAKYSFIGVPVNLTVKKIFPQKV